MSEKTPTPVTETTVIESEVVEESAAKPSFVAKTKHFVKQHKRPALAVGALVALVGVAAVAGKKADQQPDFSHLELEPAPVDEDVAIITDTPVA